MPDQRCYIFSETSGLVEHCVDLGDSVKEGQLIAKVHNIERTGVAPVEYFAEIDGIYTGRHYPGLIVNGDFLGLVAVPV
jgi:N-alpha-acetyl-L-2,4-diaminobutyrate deacetylase